MTKIIRWSKYEDSVLLRQVKAHPQNLSVAFMAASKKLPLRSASACSQRWYSTVSKKAGKTHTAFACLGKSSALRNRKISNSNKAEVNSYNISFKSLWNKCKEFFNSL